MAAINETQQKDVAEARNNQNNLLKSEDKFSAHFLYWFSWFWSIVSTIYFFGVTFFPIAKDSQHYADIILGFLLGTAVATIIGYFFGNSKE